MIIALRRGTDWVATGIYNATDTRPDGSPRFNPASDYVVKYTLKNITGDTATYKNPVRIAAGMTSPNYYGNGQVSSSGKTTPVYCVQHDDGTIYVLDGYDPWAKMYFYYPQRPDNLGGFIHNTTQTNIFEFYYSSDQGMEPDIFKTGGANPNYLIKPVGYTSTMTFNPDKTLSSIQHYYPDPTTGAPTPFTYWYLDPNGIPIEFGGQTTFAYASFNDPHSLWMGGFVMPGSNDGTIAVQTHSIGYHSLFFQNERASFVNAIPGGNDLLNYATQIEYFTDLMSSTTMQLMAAKYSTRIQGPTARWRGMLLETKDGMYIDSSGKRYDFVSTTRNDNNQVRLGVDSIALPLLQDINTFDSGWYSDIGSLTQLTIPSITPPNTTISFANVPAPVYSTTNTLYKNVDYIMTGLYTPGQFLNDIVVKCKINGQIGKYKVCSANGDLSLFFIQYTNPTTGAVTNYRLDSFDPYERYYSAVTAENSRSIKSVHGDRETFINLVLSNLVKQNGNNFNYYRNQFLATQVSQFFKPVNYQRVVGNQFAVDWMSIYQSPTSSSWGSYPVNLRWDSFPINYQQIVNNNPGRLFNNFWPNNVPNPNAVISESDRYRLTYTYNNNTVEYSVVAFTNDPVAQVPIEHSGELYFMDPSELRQSRIRLKDMSYHKFFYEGETAGFYNRPGPLNNNAVTSGTADIFGNLPFPSYGARVNTSIPGGSVTFDNDWNQSVSGAVSIPGYFSLFPQRRNGTYEPTAVYMAQDSDPFSSVMQVNDDLQWASPIILRCSLSLHTARATGSVDMDATYNLSLRPSAPNQNVNFISYLEKAQGTLTYRTVITDKCIIMSPCGLYTDAAGNRYDYVTIVNNAGYYVPVESLTNQMSMADITAATGGFLVGKVLPGTAVTLDAAAVAALQSNTGTGSGGTTGGGTSTGGGTTGGTDTGTGGSGSGGGTGGTGTGGTGTGGTDTGTGGSGGTTGGGTGTGTGGTDTGSGSGGTGTGSGGTGTGSGGTGGSGTGGTGSGGTGGTDTGTGGTTEATFLNIPVSKLQTIAVFAGAVGVLVAIWYFGGLGGAAVSSAGGSALYASAL